VIGTFLHRSPRIGFSARSCFDVLVLEHRSAPAPVSLFYAVPLLLALLTGWYFVRRTLARARQRREPPRRKPPATAVSKMSARSEMRAYDDATTVMVAVTRPGPHRKARAPVESRHP
jgi:hypothetical protein